ncbi:hypothetical protein A176_003821 [Myxococcus hansupus]|uniref:Uncharacterized protein n=1 Tax=Pseudomyxococcus hansupus TaxID=1297742 RepID=A0A0H4WVR3_9BACT|nr:hypothetical protein [Myxococcus hansupus]AKQ66909.1 hypothetical protein A176_003821 [Myxococcus hansupus]
MRPNETSAPVHHTILCTRRGFKPDALHVQRGDSVEFSGHTHLDQHVWVFEKKVRDTSLFGSDDIQVPNEGSLKACIRTISESAKHVTYDIQLWNEKDPKSEPMNGTITVNHGQGEG